MAGGLPSFCDNDPNATEIYMQKLRRETGYLDLTADKMVKNPAMRQTAKTLVCSIIGKAGTYFLFSL